MKIDGGLGVESGFDGIKESCQQQEELGYDGLWVPETAHDPFTMLPLMAEATENVELGTGIVVGFARNPMDICRRILDSPKAMGIGGARTAATVSVLTGIFQLFTK